VAQTGSRFWLFVNDIEARIGRVGEQGGRVISAVAPEGPRRIARVADPAGPSWEPGQNA
jgi:predicted enzyme related to lactoylglutathione lyase